MKSSTNGPWKLVIDKELWSKPRVEPAESTDREEIA